MMSHHRENPFIRASSLFAKIWTGFDLLLCNHDAKLSEHSVMLLCASVNHSLSG